MAEGGGSGERLPGLCDRGDATGWRDLTVAREHLPALRAGRVGRDGGGTTPERATHPGPVDFVMAFEDHLDAKRVFEVLGQRRPSPGAVSEWCQRSASVDPAAVRTPVCDAAWSLRLLWH